jgi:serine/threonine protein kinase
MTDEPARASTPHRRLAGLRPDALMARALETPESGPVTVGGVEVGAFIGRGGMGAVYLGRQVSLDRDVAVKVLAGELADDPLFLERLEREARVMARLRHPNIVAVHDFQRTGDGAAIVMELVEGGSLREKLRHHPQGLPLAEALRMLRQIAAGLEAAHAAGVIHRDMKPENVLIGGDGMARVTDFGLALPLMEGGPRLTRTGTAAGTVEYMAPEQFRGGEMDARLDQFALGVIAYELLTGRTPRGSFDAPHQVRADIPPHVSAAVMRALRPEPVERFASVADFILALHAPAPRTPGVLPWLLVCAVLLAAGWLLWPKMDQTPGPQPGPWRDAIAGTRIYEDVLGGDWKNEDGVLTSNEQICIVKLEETLPEYYDVRMRFTRLGGMDSVALFFTANTTVGCCDLDAWREGLAGVQNIGGESLLNGYGFRFPLENGRAYEMLVEVRPGEVRVSVDGEFKKTFNIEGKYLHPPVEWEWNPIERPAALAIGSYMSPTRFEKVEWRSQDHAIKGMAAAK